MSDFNFPALILASATAVVAAATKIQPELLGAPMGVLLAAHAGALFGLSQTPPEKWGKVLAIPERLTGMRRAWAVGYRAFGVLFTVTANAFLMAWVVVFMPHIFTSLKTAPLAAAAGILAFGGQHLIPRMFKAAGDWVEGWGGKKP